MGVPRKLRAYAEDRESYAAPIAQRDQFRREANNQGAALGKFARQLKQRQRDRALDSRPGASEADTLRRFASLLDHIPTEDELRRAFRRIAEGEDGYARTT